MKQYVFLLVTLLNITWGFGQNETIDRLRQKLSTELTDTGKCQVLDSLSMYNMFFNHVSDSTFSYCDEYINVAFRIPDKKYLALAYARLSFYYNNTGKYKEALNMALKGLNLSDQYHIRDYLSALYYDIAWVYLNLNDFADGLNNTQFGISFLKSSKDPFFDQALHLYGMLGNFYQNINKPDSAFFYYSKDDSLANMSKELAPKTISNWYWTQYYLSYKKDYQKADSIINDAIADCFKYRDFLLNFFYLFSSDSYLEQGEIEKAIAQAKKSYLLSLPITDLAGENWAAGLLNACYAKLGNRDSAYHYLEMKDSINDLIQSHTNAFEIQQVQFDQQLSSKEQEAARVKSESKMLTYIFVTALAFLLLIAFIQWRNSAHRKKTNSLLQQQKEKVEHTLSELKSTQAQLIQSEKMASLGELTAGIAHEIQNPLNFVNNFSEVNTELIEEADLEIDKGNISEAKIILNDIKENEQKINHHGKRAGDIVKGMLQHSRKSSGVKELTDINKLADEYLRLAYHGLRAKDKTFNAEMKTDYDETISKITIVPQDIGRVILNLITNAFYAVTEKKKQHPDNYEPTVSVSTKKINDKIEIRVKDNGNGIPQKVVDKIFQPFFTTKPTGVGTGLGLSLSYDIVKAHGGEINVETKEGEGSEFVIKLPVI